MPSSFNTKVWPLIGPFRLPRLRRYRSINARFHICRLTPVSVTLSYKCEDTLYYKIVMTGKSRIFAMWSVVLIQSVVSCCSGRWSVIVLVGGRCCSRPWSVVFKIGGRWFIWSVVGDQWSVIL